jgi:hypothetical protein
MCLQVGGFSGYKGMNTGLNAAADCKKMGGRGRFPYFSVLAEFSNFQFSGRRPATEV